MASVWLGGCLDVLDVLLEDSQMVSVWLSECLTGLDVLCVDSQMASGSLMVGDDVVDVLQVSLCLIGGDCGLEVSAQKLGWRQLVFQCETLEVEERMIC